MIVYSYRQTKNKINIQSYDDEPQNVYDTVGNHSVR